MKPLAVDLCCGLGGWTDGLLAEGWDVIGFDVERHIYGTHCYPAQLVLQDIRTLSGEQFRGHVSLIICSPPCQEFSYLAMPWKRGKQIAAALRGQGDFPDGYKGSRTIPEMTALFDACVRIGREAGVPTVIENVRGAQPWVGRAKWAFGSFMLWGDVPALMPIPHKAVKVPGMSWSGYGEPGYVGQGFNHNAEKATKNTGGKVRHDPRYPHLDPNHPRYDAEAESDGVKQGGDWFNAAALDKDGQQAIARRSGSKSNARKAASARIAMIPATLARHLARVYKPEASR